MTIGDYAENKLLDAVFNATAYSVTTPYISLHTADPGETGASEVSGGSYARQSGTFIAASGGTLDNDAIMDFTDMPAVTVTHMGVWDAASGGNFLWGGVLVASKTVNAGDTFRFPVGNLDINLN